MQMIRAIAHPSSMARSLRIRHDIGAATRSSTTATHGMRNALNVVALSGGRQRPSRTLPIGVCAAESDVDRYEIASPALRTCIALAVDRAVPPPRPVTLAVVAA
ncbi:hypothetical protein WI26_29830 [Burkholderia diffusa]|nr:hypothetical protein WI26_29830 [Burkholderia diffusa]